MKSFIELFHGHVTTKVNPVGKSQFRDFLTNLGSMFVGPDKCQMDVLAAIANPATRFQQRQRLFDPVHDAKGTDQNGVCWDSVFFPER